MSLEDDIFEKLAPLVMISASPLKGRVYPNTLPQQFTYPAIRFQTVSQVPFVDLCGDGDEETDETHIQIDVVDNEYDPMMALVRSVRAAMATFDPPAILDFFNTDFDAETRSHRGLLEYSFHGSTSP